MRVKVVEGITIDVDIIVKEQEKIVVAIGRDCSMLAFKSFGTAFHSINMVILEEDCKLYDDLLMDDEYSGVARCSEDDEFDIDTGVDIAVCKLCDKLKEKIYNRRYILAKEFYATAIRLEGWDTSL
jgi:hypothetical protein